MTYKTLVTVLSSLETTDRVLSAARLVARQFDGHVIGVHAEPSPAAYVAPVGIPDVGMVEAAEAANKARAKSIKDAFNAGVSRDGLAAEFRDMETFSGDSALSALESARCADLVVAPQNDPAAENEMPVDLEALVFDSGRPVLLVPYAGKIPEKIERVLIGWNGTRESARAVFDALPFLFHAKTIEVLTVDPRNTPEQSAPMAGTEIATALARHGLKVTTETQMSGSISAAAVIENRVADMGADLLVMGAYSRSRLSERLFGGVTREVLTSMPALTLMSR